MDAAQWLEFAREGGATAVLILALMGLLRGWVVTERQYESMRSEKDSQLARALHERDYWMQLAFDRAIPLAEKSVGLAERRRERP